MSPSIGWSDVLLRVALTLIAGALLGFDRSERGKAAGIRTTMLVALAASVAMVLSNLLVATAGRPLDPAIKMDVLRLPLGTLTASVSSAPAR